MGTKIKCLICGDIIEGDKQGHLISCSCNKCYIDETPFYCRIGGDPEYMATFDENGNEKRMIQEAKEYKIERVDKINYYLDIAETVSERSTCLDSNYGAIIVKNDEVISTGYNGAPRGIKACIEHGKCMRQSNRKLEVYLAYLSVHAEQNAIISAKRENMIGSTLYLVGKKVESKEYVKNPEPCIICKRMIINAGISKVIVRISKSNYKASLIKEIDEYKYRIISDWDIFEKYNIVINKNEDKNIYFP